MNSFILIIISSIIATTAMTVFSYIVSALFNKLYKEPRLLNNSLSNILHSWKNNLEVLSWCLHYFIGFSFVVVYHYVWEFKLLDLLLINSIYIGALSGVVAIISWYFIFKISGYNTKRKDFGYYLQLFVAHIIFAFVATLIYSIG